MHITRSLPASAFVLSLSTLTEALALRRTSEDALDGSRFARRGASLDGAAWKRQGVETLDCPNDRWQQLLDNNPQDRVVTFCNEWLGISPATTVLEVTPTM